MDIRARCCPYKNGCFSRCPAKIDTSYFHLMNNRDSCIAIDSAVTFGEKVERLSLYARSAPYHLKDQEIDRMIYLLLEDVDNEQ